MYNELIKLQQTIIINTEQLQEEKQIIEEESMEVKEILDKFYFLK